MVRSLRGTPGTTGTSRPSSPPSVENGGGTASVVDLAGDRAHLAGAASAPSAAEGRRSPPDPRIADEHGLVGDGTGRVSPTGLSVIVYTRPGRLGVSGYFGSLSVAAAPSYV